VTKKKPKEEGRMDQKRGREKEDSREGKRKPEKEERLTREGEGKVR